MLCVTNTDVFAIYDEELAALCARREEIVEQPERDFTRRTKITIPRLMNFVVSCGSEALKPAVQDFLDASADWSASQRAPYVSAFTEARKKLKIEAFEQLFANMTGRLMNLASWEPDPGSSFHLLLRAVDGTSFPYDGVSEYSDDCYTAKGTKTHQQECTAICDLATNMFTDAVVHGVQGKGTGEPADFVTMLDRATVPEGTRILYIADRAYAVPNVLAHLQESGQFFLIRDKDVDSGGFIGSLRLPDELFDKELKIKIGRSVPHLTEPDADVQTRCIAETTRFDYIEPGSRKTYMLYLRVVRFIIEGSHVVVLTNLPSDRYSVDDLVHLYSKRWSEEVDFRDLKYTLGTLAFHSRLDKFITQEIWAKFLLFNICAVIAASAPEVVLRNAGAGEVPRYAAAFSAPASGKIAVNFVVAAHAIRIDFISRQKSSTDLAYLIIKYKERIRPGRHETRNMHPRRRFYLNYRSA